MLIHLIFPGSIDNTWFNCSINLTAYSSHTLISEACEHANKQNMHFFFLFFLLTWVANKMNRMIWLFFFENLKLWSHYNFRTTNERKCNIILWKILKYYSLNILKSQFYIFKKRIINSSSSSYQLENNNKQYQWLTSGWVLRTLK